MGTIKVGMRSSDVKTVVDQVCSNLNRILTGYFNLATCSDYWSSYAELFDPDNHRSVGKNTGLTNHVERLNATLRNRLGRFTRKTLSFSKKKENHEAVLHMFLLQYNQDMKDKWITRRI